MMSKEKAIMKTKKKSPFQVTLLRLLRNPSALIGLIILFVLIVVAVIADWVRPYDPLEIDMVNKLQKPSAEHWMGTDQMGRDVLSRVMVGAKYSLSLGLLNASLSAVLGVIIGSMCGYFGGKFDIIVMRLLDVVQAIPGMLLCITISAVLGAGFWQTIIAIGFAGMPGFARMTRASVMTVRNTEYVEAAVLTNCTTARIIATHVLPNAISPVIVSFTMSMASCITMAASLSFIGLGVQPPTPEWGAMLASARTLVREEPFLMIMPGMLLMVTVLSINMVGDALRDAMDPKLRK